MSGEVGILLRELNKKKRHKPLRRLFREIPSLLLQLKPCLLMSPLSVSQYLDSSVIEFDTVIFDEASQIYPQDAIGAVLRGRQLVVAGDPKQLPPSNFFRVGDLDGQDEEAEDDTADFESVLDLCLAGGLPSTLLRWHYRSRHEHLIAFSNHHFYEGRLVTFPGASNQDHDGVRLEYVPDGDYDRSRSRTNRAEARRVVDLILEHAERTPDRSLGVVALSEAQMMAILDELERRRREQPDLAHFFDEQRQEPFFVKNLENVQGDERDAVILSVGYGPDSTGQVGLNFGPLNRAGGERRLNVAITRARHCVTLVSSLRPEAIDLSRTSSVGVRLLRQYLEFAQRGPAPLAAASTPTDGDYESEFEREVGEALRAIGLQIEPQVGCAGFRVDLAVKDPRLPGRYLLGIECDGATYHSSPTARDRDRLRQQVLEGLGWRIHRIWSTEWVRDREGELRRVLQAVEQARAAFDPTPAPENVVPFPRRPEPSHDLTAGGQEAAGSPVEREGSAATREVTPGSEHNESVPPPSPATAPLPAALELPPYVSAELPRRRRVANVSEIPISEIADLVRRCVEVEGPVHIDRVLQTVSRCWGIARVKSRVRAMMEDGVREARRRGWVRRQGDFLWPTGMAVARPRGRGRSGEVRPVHMIAPEEIAEAALLVLRHTISLEPDELIRSTARLLGFGRTGHEVESRVQAAIQRLEAQGRVRLVDGRYRLATDQPRDGTGG